MIKVIVLLAEDPSANIDETVQHLRETGLVVEQLLSPIHVVTGSIDASKLSCLRKLDGVLGVREGELVGTRL